MGQEELFEVTGELQGVANAVEGAQLVAIAHAGSHELRLTERGPVEIHHEVGFIDAMTSSEVSLATGLGQWAAGRKVGLAEALAGRFTKLLGKSSPASWPPSTPARWSPPATASTPPRAPRSRTSWFSGWSGWTRPGSPPSPARSPQGSPPTRSPPPPPRTKRDRAVQVTPGPDGTTDRRARLPAGRSAAAWAAIRDLADRYTKKDPTLTLDQARADAFIDLLLTNVTITAKLPSASPSSPAPTPSTP